MTSTEPHDPQAAFDPVGHVIVSFRHAADMQDALTALRNLGFAADALLPYTPDEMRRQAEANMAEAGVLASIGQDLNLMKADLAAAEQGHSFLVVHATDDTQAQQVADVARHCHAARARRHGRFIIEELVDAGLGRKQVFESNDRGLDDPAVPAAVGEGQAR